MLWNKIPASHIARQSIYLLMAILACSITSDIAWIIKAVRFLFLPLMEVKIYYFVIRISWAFAILQYPLTALFLESFYEKNLLRIKNILLATPTILFSLFFATLAIINFNCIKPEMKPLFELLLQKIAPAYGIIVVILPSIIIGLFKLRYKQLPQLLAEQLKILICVFILPYWFSDFLQIFPFVFSNTWTTNSYTFVSISSILICALVYYCIRRIIGLRFLNFTSHVQAPVRFMFLDEFKVILERFSQVSTIHELKHITYSFFKDAFGIPLTKIALVIQPSSHEHDTIFSDNSLTQLVDGFLCADQSFFQSYLYIHKILIYDEIEFTNFYDSTPQHDRAIKFLSTINADIFLPIFDKDKIIAYIVIERFARKNQFYSDAERDQMLIFVSYLGNLINLINSKSLDILHQQLNTYKQELYFKHQEINQYRESIRSFLRNHNNNQIGIIFYKNRHFAFGNKAGKDLIGINPNMQNGHPIAKALKTVAHYVESYKTAHTIFTKDSEGNQIVLSGVPNLDQNNTIILIHYPEISHIIKQQSDLLKDPSESDYILYLETTRSGKLINQLIPGSGEQLLNFKIDLLKIALSKKAILLDLPPEDLLPTIHLIHHISLRETLEIIDLTAPVKNNDITIQLFGINPIFQTNKHDRPLLEKLNNTGTLFIKNIHFLDMNSQQHLAEFIRQGFFRIFKSEQRVASNVHIIVSSNQNIATLTQEGKFSSELLAELRHTTLCMPSLTTLSKQEIYTLAQGYSEQAIKNQTLKNLLELTHREKEQFATERPSSLYELKNKINHLLIRKSKQNNIEKEAELCSASEISDPQLMEAARLGKRALKDEKIMTLLWQKFKSQNKIATLLGVNRSSVNRRCKEYGLE